VSEHSGYSKLRHNCSIVVSIPQVPIDAARRIQRVQAITIVWMGAEAAMSLFAAWRARSPALLAFGGDSAIELASAVVVLRRFYALTSQEDAERRAARIAGALLFALAACVVAASVMALLGYSEPKPTLLGIAILIAAAVFEQLLVGGQDHYQGKRDHTDQQDSSN
jgi:divalent metal cation (Fe/Co/Zn/Cd) transporter